MIRSFLRELIESFPLCARVLRNTRDLIEQSKPAKITPWGFVLSGHEEMAKGSFEPEETQLVRELLQDADIFVNVGANVGYYCCHALSLQVPVIAIEPLPRNLHYLLANLKQNNWSQKAEVIPAAVGSCFDILKMWGGGTGASLIKGWSSNSDSFAAYVPVLTMDRVLGDSIKGRKSLILVDIEGAELMMLRGAGEALRNEPRPVWLVEIMLRDAQPLNSISGSDYLRSFKMFFDNGYRAFTADKSNREIKLSDVEAILMKKLQLETSNFIFRV